MKRPVGVVITAVLQFLGSLLVLIVAAATAFVPRLAPKTPAQPELPTALFLALSAIYLVFAVLGLATAIGIFQLKRWARYSTLIFAGFLAGIGLLMAAIFAILPFPAPPNETTAQLPPNFGFIFKTAMVLIQLAVAALGAWWLYYFTRAKTKLRFEGESNNDVMAIGRRPLSIAILSVLSFMGLPWMLVGAWRAFPISFLGLLAEGTGARIVYLVFAAAALYIGVGLWRLVPASRLAAIGLYIFGWVNAALFYVLPGREERYHRMLTESVAMWHLPNIPQQPQQFMIGAWAGIVGTLIISAIAIYYLVTRRYAFQPQAALPSDVPPPVLPAN